MDFAWRGLERRATRMLLTHGQTPTTLRPLMLINNRTNHFGSPWRLRTLTCAKMELMTKTKSAAAFSARAREQDRADVGSEKHTGEIDSGFEPKTAIIILRFHLRISRCIEILLLLYTSSLYAPMILIHHGL